MNRLPFLMRVFKRPFYKVFVIAGGYNAVGYLRTTEMMTYSQGYVTMWRKDYSASLPRAMKGVTMLNLNNHIYLFGGYSSGYTYYDDIFQYKKGVWVAVGKMKTKRGYPAVSAINYNDVCT